MKYKENRTMKVYQSSDRNYQPIPQIKLQGKWLEDLGFAKGTPINIKCQDGRLIITSQNEFIVDVIEAEG
jgi:hypothetical protein